MKLRQTLIRVVFGCGSLALLASGAAADWLVASDGSRIETQGPFKVEGKLVIFTLPNGTLGSMPASKIDLEATRALAERAVAEARPAEEPARPKAVLVITDADVGHPNLTAVATAEEGETPPAETPSPALEVRGWREEVDLESTSVAINGTLANPTANPATSIAVDVLLFDEEGGLLERSQARLERGFLNPGATTRFTAIFNETLSYDRVEFDIRSRGFMSNPPADEPSSEDESLSAEDEEDDNPDDAN